MVTKEYYALNTDKCKAQTYKYIKSEKGRKLHNEFNNAYMKRKQGNQIMIWLYEFKRVHLLY